MADGVQLGFHSWPAFEDTACVWLEAYDVAEGFEFRKRIKDDDGVASAVAFDGGGEAGETGADDDDFHAGGRGAVVAGWRHG